MFEFAAYAAPMPRDGYRMDVLGFTGGDRLWLYYLADDPVPVEMKPFSYETAPELLELFLSLDTLKPDALLEFARVYGQLQTHVQTVNVFWDDGQEVEHDYVAEDPQVWTMVQTEMRYILELVTRFRNRAEEPFTRPLLGTEKDLLLREAARERPSRFAKLHQPQKRLRGLALVPLTDELGIEHPQREGMLRAQQVVNYELSKMVSLGVSWSPDGQWLVPTAVAHSLEGFLWLEIAHQAALHQPVRTCKFCDTWIFPLRADRLYCVRCSPRVTSLRRSIRRAENRHESDEQIKSDFDLSDGQLAYLRETAK